MAVGPEQRAGARVVVRGGVRAQTIDRARPSASGGASVALTTLIWADVQVTGGSDRADRSWTIGLRANFDVGAPTPPRPASQFRTPKPQVGFQI